MTRLLTAAILALASSVAFAAGPSSIEDVAFFPESGWNRDGAVLQFNTFFSGERTAHDITQEWATSPSGRHQLSYTIPLYDEAEPLLGDASLNYRFQLTGKAHSSYAIAPRLSLLLPTREGDDGERTGGLQFAIPFSVAISSRLESHSSVGGSWFSGERESELALTQSFAYNLTDAVTLSVDAASTRSASGDTVTVVRPGIQFAFELRGGVSVAPGVAFPTGGGALFFVTMERPLPMMQRR